MCEFFKWGVYVGEYIVLLVWFAWGTGNLLTRLAIASWIGIPWMLASWIGFAATRSDLVFEYTHEFSQILNVVPLAFVISSLPLFLIRKRFSFSNGSNAPIKSYVNDTRAIIMLGVIVLLVGFAYITDKWLLSNLGLSLLIAIVLGVVATISSPLFAIAFLKPQLNLSVLLPAFVSLPLLGLVFSRFYGMPGPGAAVVFATLESMLMATVALGPIIATFWYWRCIGIRIKTSRTA